jgi:hypothetical protein
MAQIASCKIHRGFCICSLQLQLLKSQAACFGFWVDLLGVMLCGALWAVGRSRSTQPGGPHNIQLHTTHPEGGARGAAYDFSRYFLGAGRCVSYSLLKPPLLPPLLPRLSVEGLCACASPPQTQTPHWLMTAHCPLIGTTSCLMSNGGGPRSSELIASTAHHRKDLTRAVVKSGIPAPAARLPLFEYGWTGQRSGSGLSDRPPAALGVFASLDRF